MRRPWIAIAILLAATTAACGRSDDVRSFEETRAQFTAHQSEFEALAAKVRDCGSISLKDTPDLHPCPGGTGSRADMIADLKRLGLKRASASDDGSIVILINGEDDTLLMDVGVMSEMVRYSTPQPDPDGYALTPPPHHWFYSQHD